MPSTASQPFAGLHVLIADANRTNQLVAKAVLTRAGCTVHTVTDGHSAFACAMSDLKAYDAVLTHLETPVGPTALLATLADIMDRTLVLSEARAA